MILCDCKTLPVLTVRRKILSDLPIKAKSNLHNPSSHKFSRICILIRTIALSQMTIDSENLTVNLAVYVVVEELSTIKVAAILSAHRLLHTTNTSLMLFKTPFRGTPNDGVNIVIGTNQAVKGQTKFCANDFGAFLEKTSMGS